MSGEVDLYGMIKHLPENHPAVLEYWNLKNTVARYLECQQEVWKLRDDIKRLKEGTY